MSNVSLKNKMSSRLIAVLLSIAVMFSILPLPAVSYAEGNYVTVSVVDEGGEPITGGRLSYAIHYNDGQTGDHTGYVDDDTPIDGINPTNVDGIFNVISEGSHQAGMTITATVTKDNYTASIYNVPIESGTANIVIVVPNIRIKPYDESLTYNGSDRYLVVKDGAIWPGEEVIWKVKKDNGDFTVESFEDEVSFIPMRKDAGTYTTELTVVRNGVTFIQTTETTINRADINVDITPVEGLKYDGTDKELVELNGEIPEGVNVKWYVNGEEETLSDGQRVPQRSAVGTYTVKLVITGDNYNGFEQEETVEIGNGVLDLNGLTIKPKEGLIYNGTDQEALEVSKPEGAGYALSYSMTGENGPWSNEIPKVKDAGSYMVYVKATQQNYDDAQYETYPIEVTVRPKDFTFAFPENLQDRYEIEVDDSSFNTDGSGALATPLQYSFEAELGNYIDENPEITYELTYADTKTRETTTVPADIANIDQSNGMLTVNKPGTFKITAKISPNGNHTGQSSIEKEITVFFVCTEGTNGVFISFGDETVMEYILGTNGGVISNKTAELKNGAAGNITYSIPVECNYIAISNEEGTKGTLTVNDYDALAAAMLEAENNALVITVTAQKEENDYYGEDSAEYTITIKFLDVPANPFSLYAPGNLENPDGILIENGPNGENGWYNTSVTVKPATGYNVAKNAGGFENADTSKTVFSDQGIHTRYVYLQNNIPNSDKLGGITAPIDTRINKIDTTVLSDDMSIEFQIKPEEMLLEMLTLGFYNSSLTIEFSIPQEKNPEPEGDNVQDSEGTTYTSGIDYLKYRYVRAENASESVEPSFTDFEQLETTIGDDDIARATVTLTETVQYNGTVQFIAVDKAGNESQCSSDSDTFIIDAISPVMEVAYRGAEPNVQISDGYETEYGIRHYANGDVEFTLNVTETNFTSDEITISVKRDDVDYVPEGGISWSGDENSQDKNHATFTLSGDGDYVISITGTDALGNPMILSETGADKYTSPIITIDTIAPVVEASHANGDSEGEFNLQKTTFKITEHNFTPEHITVKEATVEDITEVSVVPEGRDIAEELTQILRNANNWTEVEEEDTEDTWECDFNYSFDFDGDGEEDYLDGIYNLTIGYEDYSNWSGEKNIGFTIDHTAPENFEITYHAPAEEVLKETLTLGFYNAAVVMTFTGHDLTSGIDTFTWNYQRQAGASESNVEFIEGEPLGNVQQDQSDWSKFTAEYTLTADEYNQYRGHISVKAADNFKNENEAMYTDNDTVIILDTIEPKMMSIQYNNASSSVEGEDGNMTYYFGREAEITLNIKEANFFADDVEVSYKKVGEESSVEVAQDAITWVNDEEQQDTEKGTFTLSLEDGDYVINVSYPDRSGNLLEYTSETITIDTTAPVVEAIHADGDSEGEFNLQKTTFTIEEHNFTKDSITVTGSTKNIKGEDVRTAEYVQNILRTAEWTKDGDVYTFEYDGYVDGIYNLTIGYTDYSDWSGEKNIGFTIDHTAPQDFEITYHAPAEEVLKETLTLGFYNAAVVMTFTGHDYTSGIDTFTWNYQRQEGASESNVEYTDDYTLEGETVVIQDQSDKSKFTAEHTLTADEYNQYRGHISVKAADNFKNENEAMYTDNDTVIILDTIEPEMDILYESLEPYEAEVNTVGDTHYFGGDVEVTLNITEANFFAEDVTVTVTKDGEEIGFGDDIWGDTNIQTDLTVGTFTLSEDGDYKVYVTYLDRSGNEMVSYESDIITIDTTPPIVGGSHANIDTNDPFYRVLEGIYYYNSNVEVTLNVTERNFYVEDVTVEVLDLEYSDNPEDAVPVENVVWGETNAEYLTVGTFTLSGDGDYKVYMTHTDKSLNESNVYESETITIDTTDPIVGGSHDNIDTNDPFCQVLEGIHYYNSNVEVTLNVTERNFYVEGAVVKVLDLEYSDNPEDAVLVENVVWGETDAEYLTVGTFTLSGDGDYKVYMTHTDKSDNKSDVYESETITIDTTRPVVEAIHADGENYDLQKTMFTIEEHNFTKDSITVTGSIRNIKGEDVRTAEYVQNILRTAEWVQDGDVYTFEYDGYVDGIYDLTIGYTDYSDWSGDKNIGFTIDHTAPTDVTITYKTHPLNTVRGVLTNWLFFHEYVTVELKAEDVTSGVGEIKYRYTEEGAVPPQESDNSDYHTFGEHSITQDGFVFSVQFDIFASQYEQYRGNISALAVDKFLNEGDLFTDDKNTIVLDTISPEMSIQYESKEPYEAAIEHVDGIHYFGGDVEVTLNVKEANFYEDNVVVTVTRDGTPVEEAVYWGYTNEDVTVGTFTLSGDGDYVVSVTYTDKSGNPMADYESDTITIDTTKPIISVGYAPGEDVEHVNTIELPFTEYGSNVKSDYFNGTRTATVTITEHNFDPECVEFTINALDVNGNEVEGELYKLPEESDWEREGDIHTATIEFFGDANYSFDVAYTDYADNDAEDYATKYFTVDTTPPKPHSLPVEAYQGVGSTIIETLSFGLVANGQVEVIIKAQDDTSGIHAFSYSYENAEGVSSVNSGDYGSIAADAITYDGAVATASFTIPREHLGDNNQFNGTVSFTAYDRSGNNGTYNGSQIIVVDNIAPNCQVEYSPAVNEEGGVSYYDGNIDVTVTVTEANFDEQDVHISVTRDGAAVGITPHWVDNSVDVHVGTFTLTQDGDYFVTVDYTDKSGNEMDTHESNQLTIDTSIEAPTYTINGEPTAEIGGAYKGDATIAFNFEDKNFDDYTIELTRTRFDSVENVTEEFIDVSVTETGGFGSFDIPNVVENDGVYVLKITVEDKAYNPNESEVKFSINRYGSVYVYSESLVSLIKDGGQYVKAVPDDLVITEYNADKLLEGSLDIRITRDLENIDGEPDYTPNPVITDEVEVGESGWYQYEYTISASNFDQDGVYKIELSSEYATVDSDRNPSNNTPDNSTGENGNDIVDDIRFTVDSVCPEIRNIVNLDEPSVRAQSLVVNYNIVDIGGLASVEIFLNGESMGPIVEFGDDIYDYSGEFTIYESAGAQTVRFKVTDLAGNVTDTDSDDFSPGNLYTFNEAVTVSTDMFVLWYANKLMFWGSIGGVILLAAAILFVIALKRKKTEEKQSA